MGGCVLVSASTLGCWLVEAFSTSSAKISRFDLLIVLLVPDDFVASPQLAFALFLRLCELGIRCFNLNNRGFTLFFTQKIAFLHHKVAASPKFCAVISRHGLVEGEAFFGYAALLAFSMGKTAVGAAESVGFIVG